MAWGGDTWWPRPSILAWAWRDAQVATLATSCEPLSGQANLLASESLFGEPFPYSSPSEHTFRVTKTPSRPTGSSCSRRQKAGCTVPSHGVGTLAVAEHRARPNWSGA